MAKKEQPFDKLRANGNWVRLGVLLATLIGLAAAGWAFGRAGLADAERAATRLGVAGFLLFCLWSLGQFAMLGAAWWSVAPGQRPRRLALFGWARMVREAVSDLLPFSQLGGLAVSARLLVAARVPGGVVGASMLADMVTEMASQLAVTLVGLALIAPLLIGSDTLRPLVAGGVAVMLVIMIGFYLAQRWGSGLVGRLAPAGLAPAETGVDEVERLRAEIFANRRRMAAAFALNLTAWLATVGGAWLALRLMGSGLSFGRTLSLEVLIFTLRSVAFAVPGAIGVQEAGYALAGPLLGLPAEAALALSLAKRARDLAIGLPTLLIWQIAEARVLARERRNSVV